MREIRDWPAIIDRLNDSKSGARKIEMGSPGSAQVTRCRLLAEYNGLDASTKGNMLFLNLASG